MDNPPFLTEVSDGFQENCIDHQDHDILQTRFPTSISFTIIAVFPNWHLFRIPHGMVTTASRPSLNLWKIVSLHLGSSRLWISRILPEKPWIWILLNWLPVPVLDQKLSISPRSTYLGIFDNAEWQNQNFHADRTIGDFGGPKLFARKHRRITWLFQVSVVEWQQARTH